MLALGGGVCAAGRCRSRGVTRPPLRARCRAGLLARRAVPLPTAMAPAPTENAFTAAVKAAGGTVKSGEEYVGRRCFRVMYAGANEGCAPLGKGGARRGACAKAAKRVAREQASVSRGSRAVSRGLRGAADRQAGRRLR